MNRRSFLADLLKGAAAFTILPSAGRMWKTPSDVWLPNNPSGKIIPWTEHDMCRFNALPYKIATQMATEQQKSMQNIYAKLLSEHYQYVKEVNDNKSRALDVFLQGHRESGTVHQMDVLLHRKRSSTA